MCCVRFCIALSLTQWQRLSTGVVGVKRFITVTPFRPSTAYVRRFVQQIPHALCHITPILCSSFLRLVRISLHQSLVPSLPVPTNTTTTSPPSSPISTMGELYRSRSMSYVRLLMAEESAYDSIRHLGDWGQLMVVDLAAVNVQAQLSERVTRLKKRIASCLYWEKRLETLRDTMKEYGVELPETTEDVSVVDVRQADVLEAAAGYIEPLDAAISKNIQFKKEQTANINGMTEMMHVIDAVLHPDSQSEAQRKRRRQQQSEEKGRERSANTSKQAYLRPAHPRLLSRVDVIPQLPTAHVRARPLLCALCMCVCVCVSLPRCLYAVVGTNRTAASRLPRRQSCWHRT